VIVRVLGPTLANYGIADPLADPTLELRDANGALLAFNDNWRSTQEAFAGGASPLKDAWTLTLGRDFPDRHFSVEFYDTPLRRPDG
jgi:hypothetical protein